jgi:hypothetical protein
MISVQKGSDAKMSTIFYFENYFVTESMRQEQWLVKKTWKKAWTEDQFGYFISFGSLLTN